MYEGNVNGRAWKRLSKHTLRDIFCNPKDNLSYEISWIIRIFNSGMFAYLCVHGKHKNQKRCKRMKFLPLLILSQFFLANSPRKKKFYVIFFYINNRIHKPPPSPAFTFPLCHAIIIDLILAAMFVYYCVIEYAAEISSHA